MDRGAWHATVHGVTESHIELSRHVSTPFGLTPITSPQAPTSYFSDLHLIIPSSENLAELPGAQESLSFFFPFLLMAVSQPRIL